MRRGLTLLELLVALTLLGGLIAALPRSSAADRARRADRDARRLATDAADLLASEIRGGVAVAPLGDTAVELTRILGIGSACESAGGLLVEDSASRWLEEPRPGDELAIWHDTAWTRQVVELVAADRCSGGRRGLRLTRHAVPGGSPVQAQRRVRWVVYRDSDGRTQLGVRDWRTTRWSAPQPAVGPADAIRLELGQDGPLTRVQVRASVSGRWQSVERLVARRNPEPWP